MANPKEWGPPLWRLLHTFAERLGRQTNYIGVQDERRSWIVFVRSVESVMPCAKCREHFQRWKRSHPLEQANSLAGEQLRIWATDWLYSLHDEVNKEKDIASPTREEVTAVYTPRTSRDQHDDIRILYELLQRASHYRLIDPAYILPFKTHLSMMMRLLF